MSGDLGCTRLAPSPTGALHLGNLRTFLITAALARQRGWRVLMRIEDIDSPRVKTESIAGTLDILAWLGFWWEEPVVVQSKDRARHALAMERLVDLGLVYASDHTRRDIEAAASAPNLGDHEVRFPDSLRPSDVGSVFESGRAWRLLTRDEVVRVRDVVVGERSFNAYAEVGDFVVWTKRDAAAYQLAVIVDDDAQGVTDVVRGDDLLSSAGRQELLARELGLTVPRWWHVPLVLGQDGRRLAKRHGDTRLEAYREAGVTQERLIGLCAYWSGIVEDREVVSFDAFCEGFSLDTLPPHPVRFTQEDDAWLVHGS